MEKKPLIVFSGGMDSSYMLWLELQKGDVYTCYIHGVQSQDKVPLELAARRKVIDFFEKRTGNKVISDTVVRIGAEEGIWMHEKSHLGHVTSRDNIPPDSTWTQAHMWLFGSLYVTDGTKHSKLLIGNVIGDGIALHLADQKMAWDYLQRFSKQHPVPLEFPLAYTPKDTILQYLPPEMLKDVWVCEMPEHHSSDGLWHPCNRCPPCVTMLKTIWAWEYREGRNFKEYVEEKTVSVQPLGPTFNTDLVNTPLKNNDGLANRVHFYKEAIVVTSNSKNQQSVLPA